MKQDNIKAYDGNKIIKFENFNENSGNQFHVSNKYMKSILEELSKMGITVQSIEEPTYEVDGMIELTDTSYLTVMYNNTLQGSLELSDGTFKMTDVTKDLTEALSRLSALKSRHNINESDYTADNEPRKPSPYLKMQRANKVAKATALIENAIQELKHVPKLDSMNDIPNLISKLEELIGEKEDCGLRNLVELYKNEK